VKYGTEEYRIWYRAYYARNRKKKCAQQRLRNRKNPKKTRRYWRLKGAEYRRKFPARWIKYHADYRARHRDERRLYQSRWKRDERRRCPEKVRARARNAGPDRQLAQRMRARIYGALKFNQCTKGAATKALIGTSWKHLKAHLEAQFKPGMSWDNYGPVWHVDHVRPCAAFDLSRKSEQKKCFSFKNLQPLWARDNLIKHAKIAA
jgi:Prasinovirus endonuclease VII